MGKFCSKCGSQIPDEAVFCPECGAKVTEPEKIEAVTEEIKEVEEEIDKTVYVKAPEKAAELKEQPEPDPVQQVPAETPAKKEEKPVPVDPVPVKQAQNVPPKAAPAVAPAVDPAVTPAAAPVVAPTVAPQEKTYPPVKTGYYFWMMLLFAIPVVGLVVCIITAFALKNPSKKNFSRAVLIWVIVGVVCGILLTVAAIIVAMIIIPKIGDAGSGLSGIIEYVENLIGQYVN